MDLKQVADYAIGDVQGCYDPLQRLLELIAFDEKKDRLWFVGDLVNRGPDSLAVLRFVHSLVIPPIITLGNHDLHLLSSLFGEKPWKGKDDTIEEILKASDGESLGHWLRQHPILYYSAQLNTVMCHAGIAPLWDLEQARLRAQELEQVLSGPHYKVFLSHMYGNEPAIWSEELEGMDRLRIITNYFTRMRFCDEKGRMELNYKGTIDKAPSHCVPWYEVPERKPIEAELVFGHWAALMGRTSNPRLHALDTGCVWGGPLTALRLQDRKKFSVQGMS